MLDAIRDDQGRALLDCLILRDQAVRQEAVRRHMGSSIELIAKKGSRRATAAGAQEESMRRSPDNP